jgi:phosphate transport system substrate-binding protein
MNKSAEEAPMQKRKGLVLVVTLVATVSMLAAGCGSSSSGGKSGATTTTGGSDTTATTAAKADTSGLEGLSGKLDGRGSSFQDTFEQQVASDFASAAKGAGSTVTVTYTKTGSSDGKKALGDQTVSFAGSDSPIKAEEQASFGSRKILYFPIIGGPIAVTYNLKGVDSLNLSAEVVAKIFQGDITTWNDAAITKDNPKVKLPSEPITVVHRSDGSGTTSNFTKFLKAATPAWKLDASETVNWPSGSNFQGAQGSTGVTGVVKSTEGALTYADLSDAAKENLTVANIGNPNGEFVAPTPDGASKALAGAEIKDDLTYNPLNAKAKAAYPITSPTWILVDAMQKNKATADLLKAYLDYVLTVGQVQAKKLLYAPLPDALAKKAVAQIASIKVG